MEITYGWMEVMVELFWRRPSFLAVIPTVAIPLTIIGVIISAVASFIAGLFGLELKWEGPKRLLEVFLQPRVIISMILLNFTIWSGVKGYNYLATMSRPLYYVMLKNKYLAQTSDSRKYEDNIETVSVIENPEAMGLKTIKNVESIWETKIGDGSFGGIVFSGPSMFMGSNDGNIYELDLETGNTLRKFYVGTSVTAKVIVWNEMLFAGEGTHNTHHARIYAFDLRFGTLKGTYQTKGHTEGPPVIYTVHGQTLMFVMSGADGIHAIDPLTMKKVWHQKLGHVDSEVRVEGDRVYFSRGIERDHDVRDHKVYALDFFTGKIIWETDSAASSWRAPIVYSDRVCWSFGEIFVPTTFGQVACYDKSTGRPLTSVNLVGSLIGTPQKLGSDTIITADLQGGVCSVNPFTAGINWCSQLPKSKHSYASATYDGYGNVLFPTEKEGLVALNYKTGEKVFQWNPSDKQIPWYFVMSSLHIQNDHWYIVDWKGTVRKLKPVYASN